MTTGARTGGHLGHDLSPALLESAAASGERDGFARSGLGAEVLALLLEAGAAARRRGETPEPAQRVIALLHAAMVLRDAVIFVTAGAVVASGFSFGDVDFSFSGILIDSEENI